ncbi:MAG: helix-turn-helix domain-containing protein [Urechidicola sp.]|nr:helix-turn-helix domain-containing protein [Urechidicola sp.]
MQKNLELDLALNFVENTDRNIFLTGKAGTGKTTFLHQIKNSSLKRLVVVAPTGVAAINAKGVTIHSFFQMPFGPIVPNAPQNNSNQFQRKFSKAKIDIIKSLDLLIIDEISMVRADLLDGIDQVLRKYKNRQKVFGGVQVLMIGDLKQLAPVIKPNEWELLKYHYDTSFFFSSKSFQNSNVVSIELKHIYRQENEDFITILNEIRNIKLSKKAAEVLNKRCNPDFVPQKKEGYITLTTHNNRANKINEAALNKLRIESHFFDAKIEGKFSEHSYPTYEKLELKEGAQVMFIKNDSSTEKRYYNGKIGTITFIDNENITVICNDDGEEVEVNYEIWKNISYKIDEQTKKIDEKTIGSFTQIPLRLAWAITIHKSQGLTFEKAIIDAEASFAHGQTYVALSRCKSLEGVVLKTKIKESSIISDVRVETFTKDVEDKMPDEKTLSVSKKQYQLNLIEELLNYHAFLYPVKRLIDLYYQNKKPYNGNIISPLESVKDNGIVPLLKVSTSFKNQLLTLCEAVENPLESKNIKERILKAIAYFLNHTQQKIHKTLKLITFSTDNKQLEKDFIKQVNNLEELLSVKLFCLNELKEGFSITKYLETRAKAILQKQKKLPKKKIAQPTTENPILFESLRDLRNDFALDENVHHYQIFTQKSLYEMCEKFPITLTQLKKINGMGKVRVQKYGAEIIEIIKGYCEDNSIEVSETFEEVKETKKASSKKGASFKITFDLFKSGMTVEEIAEKRELVIGTIERHLLKFVISGEISPEEIMQKQKFENLKSLIQKAEFESLSDLKTKLKNEFSYSELRLVQTVLRLNKKE